MNIGIIGVCVALSACVSAAANKQPTSSVALACDDGLKTSMSSNADTKVLLVKQFHRGDPLLLTGAPNTGTPSRGVEGVPNATAPTAGIDLCMVKLLVGPGN